MCIDIDLKIHTPLHLQISGIWNLYKLEGTTFFNTSRFNLSLFLSTVQIQLVEHVNINLSIVFTKREIIHTTFPTLFLFIYLFLDF